MYPLWSVYDDYSHQTAWTPRLEYSHKKQVVKLPDVQFYHLMSMLPRNKNINYIKLAALVSVNIHSMCIHYNPEV